MKKTILCHLGIHKWGYRLPSWGTTGETVLEGYSFPLTRDTSLREGTVRVCRDCGKHQVYQNKSDYLRWL